MSTNASDPTTPTLLGTAYNGNLTLMAFWTQMPGIDDYSIGLFQGTTLVTSGPGSKVAGMLTLQTPLDPGGTYQVAVATNAGGQTGAYGNRLLVVTAEVTGLTAAYDARHVSAQWTLPQQGFVSGAQLTLVNTTTGMSFAEQSFTGSAGSMALPSPLDPQSTYTLIATGTYGPSTGPSTAPLSLIVVAPQLTAVLYDPSHKQITVMLTPPVPGEYNPGAALFGNGALLQSEVASGTLVPITLSAVLDPSIAYTIRPYWSGDSVTGPYGQIGDVLVNSPAIRQVQFSGMSVSLDWTDLSGPPYPTGGQVVISAPGELERAAFFIGSNTGQFTPDPALNPASQYAIAVAALRGPSQGPFGPTLPVIASQVSVASVGYDGHVLTATWPGGAAPGVNGYFLLLFQGGTLLSRHPAGNSGASLSAALDPASTYTIAVQPVGTQSFGPVGTQAAVISAAPSVSAIAVAASTVTVSIVPPQSSAGIARYQALLYQGNNLVASSDPVASGASPSATINFSTAGGVGYFVCVRGLGSDTGVQGTGPLSPTVPVLSAPPEVLGASIQGTSLRVSWELPPATPGAITSSTIVITPSQGEAATFPNLPGTTATLSLAPSFLQPALTYTLSMTCNGPSGTTPPSAAVSLIPSAPALSRVGYEEPSIIAHWEWPSGASGATTASGYRMVLSSGGVILQSLRVNGLAGTLSLSGPVDPAGDYQLSVNPLTDQTEFVAQPGTAPLLFAPQLQSATTDGTDLTIAWQSPATPSAGISGYQPVVLWDDAEMALPVQPPTPTRAAIPLPADIPSRASIAIRALAGVVSGPLGNAAPILDDVPTGLSVGYDGEFLTAAWDASADGRVDGYIVTLSVTGSDPQMHRVQATRFQVAFAKPTTPNTTASVSVSAAAGPSSGPATTPVSAILHAPAISTATVDNGILTLAWAGVSDAGATAYRLCVMSDGGSLMACETFNGTAGVLVLPPSARSAQVNAIGSNTAGPPSPAATLLDAAPLGLGATFDPVSGACAISWTQDDNATGYELVLTNSGSVVADEAIAGGSTKGYTFPKATLAAPGNYAVRLRATASNGGTSLLSPWTPSMPLVTEPPQQASVSYNGATAKVGWHPLASPLVTGYRVTLLEAGQPSGDPIDTAETSVTVSLPEDKTKTYTFVVQTLFAGGTGAPSSPVAVFVPGFYLSTDASLAPYLAPAITPAKAPYDIVLYLPQIFSTPPQSLPTAAPFVMAPATGAPFVYTLTIAADSIAWTFTSEVIRSNLQTAYKTFLSTLESAQLNVTPPGLRAVQGAISRAIPQTFAETLYYAYGLSPQNGYIDLIPGMVLRAEYEAYQNQGAHVTDAAFLAGFVTSAVAEYEIVSSVSSGNRLTGLDVFLSSLTAAQGVSVPNMPPDPTGRAQGAGGIIDAFFTQFQQPHCRLVYPPNILRQDSTGSPFPYMNPMLLGASNLSDLETATDNVRNGSAAGGSVASFYFRGRVTLSALIRVVVNGVTRVVPVGTTVGNILASLGTRPPVAGLPLSGITLTRPRVTAITDSSIAQSGYPVGNGWGVRLDWSPSVTYGMISDWLDLPVLHGDRLAFGASAT